MKPGWFQITLKLFLWKDNKYLALRDSHSGLGDLPGGRIGQEELYDFSGALLREVREELGPSLELQIDQDPVSIFPHFVLKDSAPALSVVFEGIHLKGDISLSDEHTEYFWLSREDDPSRLFEGTMLDGVQKYLGIRTRSKGL